MLRTGKQYRESIQDGREVWIDGQRVDDVANHPSFKPIVDIRARIYDMQNEEQHQNILAYTDEESGERNCIGFKLPKTQADWKAKREAIKTII